MARDHARLLASIWDDDDFLNLSGDAQRLYFLLLSQRDLSYAGLLPMRLKRWASLSTTTTVDTVTAALAELDASRFVACDHNTEEVLIRSLIRRDGIYKQPNVLAGALREAFLITSGVLRGVLAAELLRLPVDVVGAGPELAAAALLAGANTLPTAVKAASGAGARKTKSTTVASGRRRAPVEPPQSQQDQDQDQDEDPSPNPSGNPSAKGSARPLGEGGRGYGALVSPPTLEEPVVGGDPRARVHASTREDAARLVAEEIPGQPRATAGKLAREVSKLLGEGIDPGHITAGLRAWAGKQLGTSLLPDLVAEAVRAPMIAATAARRSRSTTDERVAAAFALADQYAAEEARQSAISWDARESRSGDGGGPRVLAEVLAGVA
ncbi:hypothetical protein JOF56_005739 [Kibdelosporangium banguiense]|uniref:Uncharacterized protein n=1 Tax=Kibdelosporangium banguiense TaxID=1365924 RepID=A0ABS4TLQ7_9PSEU|nr:hypothetical protein [Kibdelosporangium banguiense]MBP2325354.1 hypothetical protein [Kibdelosporangium banguiense]